MHSNTTAAIIAAPTLTDGSFDRTLPTSLATGNNYKVEINSIEKRAIKDLSDRTWLTEMDSSP